MPSPLSWISTASRPLFLSRTSAKRRISSCAVHARMRTGYSGEVQATYRGGASIQTILNEFLDDGAEVDDDLTRLDLVHLDTWGARSAKSPGTGLRFLLTVRPSIALIVAMTWLMRACKGESFQLRTAGSCLTRLQRGCFPYVSRSVT
jgi:hypothetical protein